MLWLGVEGKFNEINIENSDLKRLGTGRILDTLASLKERKLIEQNNDGSFSITALARQTLWKDNIPLGLRILKLLEIKSFDIENISKFLKISENNVIIEIEKLRKNHLVLMSTLRQDSKIIQTYEILPEGVEKIKNEWGKNEPKLEQMTIQKREVIDLVDQIIAEISRDQHKKEEIILKLNTIKTKLETELF
jgi:DNA-binding PadR family transcriptional regulator